MLDDQVNEERLRAGSAHDELQDLLAELARIVPVPSHRATSTKARSDVLDLVHEVMQLCGEGAPSAEAGHAQDAGPPGALSIAPAPVSSREAAREDEPCRLAAQPPADPSPRAAGAADDADLWSTATFEDPLHLIAPSAPGETAPAGPALGAAAGLPARALEQPPGPAPPPAGPPSGAAQARVAEPTNLQERPRDGDTAASEAAPAELRAVDVAIAGGVDELLEGSFESVADVLSGVFEEHAVVVQDVERIVAEPAAAAATRAAPTPGAPGPAAGDTTRDAGGDAADPALLPARSPRQRGDPPAATVPAATAQASPRATPAPVKPRHEAAAAADDSGAAAGDTGAADVEVVRGALLLRLAPALIAPLVLLSLPLRFVPPSFRPFVDWVALSLLLWVPIVWVAALFL